MNPEQQPHKAFFDTLRGINTLTMSWLTKFLNI